MKIEGLLKLMSRQGTVRHFKSDPIPDEYLEKILQAARWAPSGANTQPWDFIVVRDPRLKEKIAQIYVDTQQQAKMEDKEFPHGADEGLKRRFTDPPILIVVCADTRFMKAYPKIGYREQIFNVSMGAAIQNMMLAANALGLGLSWGTVDTLRRGKLRELLGAPVHIRILEVLQLGFPAKRVSHRFRRDPRDFTHMGEFDISKLRSEKEIKNLLSTRKDPDIYSGVRNQGDKIIIHQEKCTGCRLCELVCAYHHEKIFSRKISSISVRRLERRGEFEITIYEKGKNGRFACDLCTGEKQPLCVKFCLPGALGVEGA